jgi:2-polyprenyl-6-methoxyphenol hydroxylase-like FAD-dependent oxidoreductase
MRIGVAGYGTGGRHFHLPFIQAARGVELAGIVARAPGTVERAKADLPGVRRGRTFETYREDATGVTAFFTDGTQARGDILIGADASNSRVRHRRLASYRAQHDRPERELPSEAIVTKPVLYKNSTGAMIMRKRGAHCVYRWP